MIIPGPYGGKELTELTAEYDGMMVRASGTNLKIASSTTRMSDVLNYGPAFNDLFLYPPLLAACRHVIGEPFKLSSLLARTLRPNTLGQDLHADLTRDSLDAPLIGFILMIDPFRQDNGATRFVPGSHNWHDVPSDRLANTKETLSAEVLGCGPQGSMIIFDGAVWHGHTANMTSAPRRSIQGYFLRGNARSGTNFSEQLLPETKARLSPLASSLLGLKAGQ